MEQGKKQVIKPAPPGPRVFMVIGGTGSGKSTLIKTFLDRANVQNWLIYDVQGEHTGEEPPPMEDFLYMATNARNSIIVFEEATIFFTSKTNAKEVRQIMTSARWRNNLIFFVFHSIRKIPVTILDMTHAIFMFRTQDNLFDPFFKKYPGLSKAQELVRKQKDFTYVACKDY